jgi:hypothetical protein
MKKVILFAALISIFGYCTTDNRFRNDQVMIMKEFAAGRFTAAGQLISNAFTNTGITTEEKAWLIRRQAIIDRTRLDFSKSRNQIREQLARYYPALTDSMIVAWEASGHLEMRMIDDAPKYFKNAVSNLFRLDTAAAAVRRRLNGASRPDPLDSIRLENTARIVAAAKSGQPVETLKITVEYSLSVDADAVPAGEEISCWLPFPRESPPRQKNVTLIASMPADALLSETMSLHNSLFSVKKAEKGIPTRFSYQASFEISGQWFDPHDLEGGKGKSPKDLAAFTRQEPPHVVFTPALKELADSLCGSETDQAEIIRKFYYWINGNIPWSSALEYSTFECIPEYVLSQRRGDCGMVTFLLLSMARYKGIPARWQSGWMLHPGEENLHDWCEIWYPGKGWVPVDMSFGLQNTDDPILRNFYMTGIDSYRMIVNDGFSGEFSPAKKYYRSEPFDFQRGEVEWAKGNLYFNQWDYQLNVLSIEKQNR